MSKNAIILSRILKRYYPVVISILTLAFAATADNTHLLERDPRLVKQVEKQVATCMANMDDDNRYFSEHESRLLPNGHHFLFATQSPDSDLKKWGLIDLESGRTKFPLSLPEPTKKNPTFEYHEPVKYSFNGYRNNLYVSPNGAIQLTYDADFSFRTEKEETTYTTSQTTDTFYFTVSDDLSLKPATKDQYESNRSTVLMPNSKTLSTLRDHIFLGCTDDQKTCFFSKKGTNQEPGLYTETLVAWNSKDDKLVPLSKPLPSLQMTISPDQKSAYFAVFEDFEFSIHRVDIQKLRGGEKDPTTTLPYTLSSDAFDGFILNKHTGKVHLDLRDPWSNGVYPEVDNYRGRATDHRRTKGYGRTPYGFISAHQLLVSQANMDTHPYLTVFNTKTGATKKFCLPLETAKGNYSYEHVTLDSTLSGLDIAGHLHIPKGEVIGAVIFLHGGPDGTVKRIPAFTPLFIRSLLEAGFIVLQPDGLGSSSPSLNVRKALQDKMGSHAGPDVLLAAEYLENRFKLDRRQVGVAGHSYGGHLALLAAAQADQKNKPFGAAFASAGSGDIHGKAMRGDLSLVDEAFSGGPRDSKQLDQAWRKASAITYADTYRTPTLMYHGEKDGRVPVEGNQRFIKAVKANEPSLPIQLVISPGESHWIDKKQPEMLRDMILLFQKNLKAKNTPKP